jgi:tetratricopeptide (TPR) repeat protein
LRGRALYGLARYAEALAFLDAVSPATLRMRAECLRALGRFAELEALIPRAAELLGVDDAWVLLARAGQAERAGALPAALRLFRAALEREPLSAEARFGLGRALVRSGARDEGLAVLAQHRVLVPLLDALDFAQRGVELAPLHAPNRAALGDAWRALASFDRGACQRALREYELACELAEASELAPIALRRARLLAEELEDLEGALEVLRKAAERDDDARLFVRAADLLAAAGREREALERLRAALRLRPDDAAILARVEALEGGR